jgi:glutathione S-transferase
MTGFMKLHWSPRSPFVRKVVIVANELHVASRIEFLRSVVTSAVPNDEVMADNPLSKIPTLVLEDGRAVYDSPVICECLDRRFGTGCIVPSDAEARFDAMQRQALGDGVLDLLLAWRGEQMRPAEKRSQPHVESHAYRVRACLKHMQDMVVDAPPERFDIGDVAIGCALGYLDFRFGDFNWRDGMPELARWHARFESRPSVLAARVEDEP